MYIYNVHVQKSFMATCICNTCAPVWQIANTMDCACIEKLRDRVLAYVRHVMRRNRGIFEISEKCQLLSQGGGGHTTRICGGG